MSGKRKCSVGEILKRLKATRAQADTVTLANATISTPEDIDEFGVRREAALILGQALVVRKEISDFKRSTNRKLGKFSRGLEVIERCVGMAENPRQVAGVGQVEGGVERVEDGAEEVEDRAEEVEDEAEVGKSGKGGRSLTEELWS